MGSKVRVALVMHGLKIEIWGKRNKNMRAKFLISTLLNNYE